MKKYTLYTERYITDVTTFEVPDDFDMKQHVDYNGGHELPDCATNIQHEEGIDIWNSDWYRLEDEDGEVVDEY